MKALPPITCAAYLTALAWLCPLPGVAVLARQAPRATVAAAPAGAPAADALAEQLQRRYEGVRDLRADFIQSYRGGLLRRTTTEQGTLQLKKPGRMRWTYRKPEEKVFISDGVRMYLYVPGDKQVIVRPMPTADAATNPAMFLIGRGHIAKDFTAHYTTISGSPSGAWALALTPRQAQQEYEWLAMVVTPGTLSLRMLVAVDAQGGTSTFSFSNVQENTGVSDNSFSFSIPKGVDIINES